MAKSDHKARTRPDVALQRQRKPTNPLGRPLWTLALSDASKQSLPDTCVTLAMGVHAIVRILANNEAFRAMQESCDTVEPGHWPFDAQLTESLFAALYMLSEHAEQACMAMMDTADAD